MMSAEFLKKFPLAAFVLAVLFTSTLANYIYDVPLQHQGYNYPHPKVPFIEARSSTPIPPLKSTPRSIVSSLGHITKTTTVQQEGYNYSHPKISFIEKTTLAHISNLKSTPFELTTQSTRLQHQGYNYPHPEVSFVEATTSTYTSRLKSTPPSNFPTIEITTASTTTKNNTSSKAKSSSTSPVNIKTSKANGYSYPRPSTPFILPTNPILSPKLASTQSSENASFGLLEKEIHQKQSPPLNTLTLSQIFPKTPSILSVPKPLTGYSYLKPLKPFILPLKTSITSKNAQTTETHNSEGYAYLKPKMSLALPPSSPVKPTGYTYSPPEILHEFPRKSLLINEHRMHPTTTPSKKVVPTKSVGYSYNQPSVPFTMPYSPNGTSSLPTQTIHQSPNKDDGYDYIRPDIPFSTPPGLSSPTPSLQTSKGYSPTPFVVGTLSPYRSPKKPLGYSYTPPKVPFATPSKTPLINNLPPGFPTTIHIPSQVKGYSYPKPEKYFEF